ncbi:MAG: clpP [Phycisphaerales bacterium]|nr:clpP [Phycisphaerales bacterium]
MANFDFKGADPRLVARAMDYGLLPETAAAPAAQPGLYQGAGAGPIPNMVPNMIPGRGPVASPMAMPGPGGGGGYNRYREMTLEEMLLENRVVFLIGEINHVSASRVIMQMLYLQSVKRDQDINLYINSPGGVVDDTLAMYDIMKFLTCDIATYCIGRAESGGAVVFAAGKKGKRFILPNAKVMIHQPFGGVYGQTADIQIQAEEILKTKNTLINILAKCTGQSVDKIRDDSERDRFFDAQQSVAYCISDEVVGEDSPGVTAEQAADATKPK